MGVKAPKVEYCVPPPEPPLSVYECPEPRQESDEYVCSRCMLRWDIHEDKPPCLNKLR